MQTPKSPSQKRLLHGATAMIMIGLSSTAARSQVPTTTTPSGIRPDAGSQAPNTQNGNTAGNVENVTVRAQRRLLREKE